MDKKHILIIWPGPCFVISVGLFEYKFNLLSEYFKGSIIGFALPEYMRLKAIGAFDFYTCKFFKNNIVRTLFSFYVIVKAVQLYYIKKVRFNVIVSPNPLLTGLQAIVIGKLTKAKVVVEINGNFDSAFKFGAQGNVNPAFLDKIKDKISRKLIRFVVLKADMAKLLYGGQLTHLKFRKEEKIKSVCFPNFVSTKFFLEQERTDGNYVLFMGYPWYLKGVDVLIRAFNKISIKYPDYKLKVIGWCPEGREYFENIAKQNNTIQLLEPIPYEEVPKIMAACSLFVLPSRTEAMGRVLIEAMACKKPIVASNVDGIPTIVKNDFNGLLFESENVDDLAEKIDRLLGNKDLAKKLAENGYIYAQTQLSEQKYVENFRDMVKNL
jgi:glycosyltransferase involved in cell wall biosynthesis